LPNTISIISQLLLFEGCGKLARILEVSCDDVGKLLDAATEDETDGFSLDAAGAVNVTVAVTDSVAVTGVGVGAVPRPIRNPKSRPRKIVAAIITTPFLRDIIFLGLFVFELGSPSVTGLVLLGSYC
jgi:hypothetical protein